MERSESELTPIETAIDEMRQRVSELEDVVFTLPTDVKKLQLRLQVNTGYFNLVKLDLVIYLLFNAIPHDQSIEQTICLLKSN